MRPAEWDHLVDGRGIKEIELARIQDEHYYMVRLAHDPEADTRPERLHQPYDITGRAETDRLLVRADTLQVRRDTSAPSRWSRVCVRSCPRYRSSSSNCITEYDCLRLLASASDAAAGTARQVRRSRRDVVLHRSVEQHAAVAGDASEPHRALAVQRPAQSRFPVLVRHASGLGHRHDRAAARRSHQQFGRTRAGILARGARAEATRASRAAEPRRRRLHFKRGMPECESAR